MSIWLWGTVESAEKNTIKIDKFWSGLWFGNEGMPIRAIRGNNDTIKEMILKKVNVKKESIEVDNSDGVMPGDRLEPITEE